MSDTDAGLVDLSEQIQEAEHREDQADTPAERERWRDELEALRARYDAELTRRDETIAAHEARLAKVEATPVVKGPAPKRPDSDQADKGKADGAADDGRPAAKRTTRPRSWWGDRADD